MSQVKARISTEMLSTIIALFKKYFSPNDHLWLFGSRADLSARGGDIDLYIETTYEDVHQACKARLQLETELMFAIGEQKIDIVLNVIKCKDKDLPIYSIARDRGILLV